MESSIANSLNPKSWQQDFTNRKTRSTLALMNSGDSSEELMARYQHGDSLAFEKLYNRHKDAIFRFISRQCTPSIAEEMFQDVWLKLIQSKQQYRTDATSKFTTYLFKIAHNRLIDYFRSTAVRNEVISSVDTCEIDDLPQNIQPSIESLVDVQRQTKELLKMIQLLPGDQREAFLLREEGGFGIQEIADITGVSRETAKSRLRYAFNRLRDGMRGLS